MKKAILLLVLVSTSYSIMAQTENMPITVGYFGHFAIHPGVKIGTELTYKSWETENSKTKTIFISPQIGFFAHPTMVIDLDTSQSLGFSAMEVWTRDKDKLDKNQRKYKSLPIEQKESYRWISSAEQSKKTCQRILP